MITIKAEMMPGDSILNSFEEATRIATMLNCYIDFNFNGISCYARPNGDPKRGEKEYHEQIKSKNQYQFASN